MSKSLLFTSTLVLLCICCACPSSAILINRGLRNNESLFGRRSQPAITPVIPAPTDHVTTATSLPATSPATSAPSMLPTTSPETSPESGAASGSNESGETFLPYQSSRGTELAECLPDTAQIVTATVVRVIDGDTIDVTSGGIKQRVRYIGIDSPEMDYPLGPEAQAENAGLVEGQLVQLVKDVSETDSYQRLLRYIFVGNVFVNEQLVRSGYAMSKGYEPDTACQELFDQAEAEAKASGLGLWAPTPTPLPEAAAAGVPGAGIVIQDIFFDGLVKRVESDEYAEIVNLGANPVDLSGWRLNAGNPGQDFIFPAYLLEPGTYCRVYTNQTHTDTGGFSYANPDPIWNNKGDCGYLYDSQGILVDDYCY